MGRLVGVAFAILLALELAVLAVVVGLLGEFIALLWSRSPVLAALAAGGLPSRGRSRSMVPAGTRSIRPAS
jgi:hypothetical protein